MPITSERETAGPLSRIDLRALKRIASETDRFGGAMFPSFMKENMERWQRLGYVKIESTHSANGVVAIITEAGRTALSRVEVDHG